MAADRCLFGFAGLPGLTLGFRRYALADARLHARGHGLAAYKKMRKKAAVFWTFVTLGPGVGFRSSATGKHLGVATPVRDVRADHRGSLLGAASPGQALH